MAVLHEKDKLESVSLFVNYVYIYIYIYICIYIYIGTIKFTWDKSHEKISVLDVMITLENGCITTELRCKPMDTHRHLDCKSCHPLHVERRISYSRGSRLN